MRLLIKRLFSKLLKSIFQLRSGLTASISTRIVAMKNRFVVDCVWNSWWRVRADATRACSTGVSRNGASAMQHGPRGGHVMWKCWVTMRRGWQGLLLLELLLLGALVEAQEQEEPVTLSGRWKIPCLLWIFFVSRTTNALVLYIFYRIHFRRITIKGAF